MEFGTNFILVTGASGWLGISLVKALVQGLSDHELLGQPQQNLTIRCLILPEQDQTSLQKLAPQIEVIQGDLRNSEDCDRFCAGAKGATLFHTAGIIHPERIKEFYQVNLEGTKNLLNSAIMNQVQRAIVVSSNSPCGCNLHPDHLFDEVSPYHPYLNYGRSKMLMELSVQDYFKSGKLETVIIRAPWFYGPNQPLRQTLFFKLIQTGKWPIIGTGYNLRSMAYIDNLCQGLILAAITEKANGQIYWIADQHPYSMNQIIDTIEQLLASEFNQVCAYKRLKLPGIISECALMADQLIQFLGLYHQKIHVLSELNKTIACSIAKAQRELGYDPKVSLEEGMRRSLQWVFQQYGGLNS